MAGKIYVWGWVWFCGPHWYCWLFEPVIHVNIGPPEIDRFDHLKYLSFVDWDITAVIWYFVSAREISTVTVPLQGR